eukprot:UN24074
MEVQTGNIKKKRISIDINDIGNLGDQSPLIPYSFPSPPSSFKLENSTDQILLSDNKIETQLKEQDQYWAGLRQEQKK